MVRCVRFLSCFASALSLIAASIAQTPDASPQNIEKAIPAVAMVLAAESPGTAVPSSIGTAFVVRQDGVLLTALHVVEKAQALQVRFKSGEVFDEVQLLGVDARRDVAALRISASGLPVLSVAKASVIAPGQAVMTISHPQGMPWSASAGVFSAYRMADEVPGAGSGYRLLQFTAPASPGSSGGVLLDSEGNALGLIVGSLSGGQNLNFAVPLESVIGLANGLTSRVFASGSRLQMPRPAATPAGVSNPELHARAATPPATASQLSPEEERTRILREFKTMAVDTQNARYFANEQLKAALAQNKDFFPLNIRLVDDVGTADVILVVGYTFAWDYPFELRHQGTSLMLLAGKGSGPFSGPAGATSVAKLFCEAVKPYRMAPK